VRASSRLPGLSALAVQTVIPERGSTETGLDMGCCVFGVLRSLAFSQRNCLSGAHRVGRLNDRPPCVLALIFTVRDFVERAQIESGDAVIAFPLQVDAQCIRGSVMVLAYNESCIRLLFHGNPSRLLNRPGALRSRAPVLIK